MIGDNLITPIFFAYGISPTTFFYYRLYFYADTHTTVTHPLGNREISVTHPI